MEKHTPSHDESQSCQQSISIKVLIVRVSEFPSLSRHLIFTIKMHQNDILLLTNHPCFFHSQSSNFFSFRDVPFENLVFLNLHASSFSVATITIRIPPLQLKHFNDQQQLSNLKYLICCVDDDDDHSGKRK